ncbi:tRNA pseudouridine(55) synthase TruB [Nocardioides aequoreus]|uniref:tRNA pseudouridine(55) synthase TruB n=1 Tax=Nocardioides aequoreus TaxID=397278 RepID=UPI0004C34054|nr:tRNA pseudouridine(55) synthase TruB [Nocardioides aequoreus]
MTASGPDGLLVVDKPGGITSHDVVARVRRALGTRKVGHAGTLDPMATGVLVLGVGRATRLLGQLTLTEKAYDATIRLGATTTTDDAEGEVTSTAATDGLSEAEVRDRLGDLVGEIDQVPSAVSAVKVDGKRAYARVRAGEEVELPARRVRVDNLDVRRLELPDLDVAVRCSSGTYVRAIARDLGASLGVGGHLTALRRTSVGPFALDVACPLDDVDAGRLLTMEQAVALAFPTYPLSGEQATDVGYGRRIAADLGGDDPVALLAPDGRFLALYRQDGDHARAVAVFTG